MYGKEIMVDQYDNLPDEELHSVLITSDGRGKENKKKALDILLKRLYDKGFADRFNGGSLVEEKYHLPEIALDSSH